MTEQPKGMKRWTRFSLRKLLILVTVVALGVIGKQQWDHWWQMRTARQLVESCSIRLWNSRGTTSDGMTTPLRLDYSCSDVSGKKQIEFLVRGAIYFEDSDVSVPVNPRIICLKILAEEFPGASKNALVEIALRSPDPETKRIAIHLASLHQDENLIASLLPLMERSTDPVVRAAIIDLIGMARMSTYTLNSFERPYYFPSTIDCVPPINAEALLQSHEEKGGFRSPASKKNTPSAKFPIEYRDKFEAIMLGDASLEERSAAARALVTWPPGAYEFRYAEWGVWLNSGGELKLSQSFLDEIPEFVHETGNPIASFEDRIEPSMIILKPVVHLSTDRPLVVDLEVVFFQGRPWYAYPHPDDFNLIPNTKGTMTSRIPLSQMTDANLGSLGSTREGYPWLRPDHRIHRTTFPHGLSTNRSMDEVESIIQGIGLRWQSLIVSPDKLGWMKIPQTADDAKYDWWKYLRDVDCSWVSNRGETERFLFYDGPTSAKSPLKLALEDATLKIAKQNLFETRVELINEPEILINASPAARTGFYVEVGHDETIIARKLDLSETVTEIQLDQLAPIKGDDVREAFWDALQSAGLRADETKGLLDSWHNPFFKTPGKRVIFLLTPIEYDLMCQMKCRPEPTKKIRVGLILTELGIN